MAVNFSKNQDEITKAWRNVVDSSHTQCWALFGYEGSTNIIKLISTGSRGLDELVDEFNCTLIQYAFCRVIDEHSGLNKLVLINWQGESAPLSRKGLCASHVGDVANYFKGCAQTITIRNDDEATKEHLMEQIVKTSASKINLSRQHQPKSSIEYENDQQQSSVKNSSSSARKIDIKSELAADRKSFWQRQEEEERERLAAEKLRATEKQAQFERERKQREELEAKKLAETIEKRDRLIDATRQADRKVSNNLSAASSTGSSSQPSSIISSGSAADTGDDGRVGRRSELIRLERNQETQSLITKGLIKNKRAIFEQQASQAQNQHQQGTTLNRRASGTMIAQRLSALKSLDSYNTSVVSEEVAASPSTGNVNKLANGLARKVSLSGDGNRVTNGTTPVKREVESDKLANNEDQNLSGVSYSNSDDHNQIGNAPQAKASPSKLDKTQAFNNEVKNDLSITGFPPDSQITPKHEMNGNIDQNNSSKQSSDGGMTELNEEDRNDLPLTNDKHGEAVALFDYEAADHTEISFDPDDRIGFIQKVDPGWWQGKVMSGRFKGQIGLFPSNYVREI